MNTLCTNANHSNTNTNANENRGAAVSAPARLLSAIKNYVVLKYNQHIDRQAFKYLLTLDDNLLKDIGVTRQDVVWASHLPLAVDASAKIEEIARRRPHA